MSAPTQPTTARRPAPATGKSRVTQYVDQQLEKTRRQVKSTDLIASILLLAVMVIGFFLLAAFLDAWVVTFTPLMRWAALLLLVTGCVVMMVFSIWPLLTKQINPDYAAKMLEDSKPGFRNSVLNYVWFRKKPDSIRGAVFDAVARQAAVDLNSVPVDSSVDRSKVIRFGFWLVGMTAAFIAYFMLSPKNPLQTLNRILLPSADLAKPAVVTIADVTPGNTSVFFGDQVEITAKVYGPHSPEQVQLIYSTNDGRQSGQVRLMQPDPTTPRQYKLDLTADTGGLRESLEYEIVARDGQSGKFEIKVAPRPAITIESIQIDPPKYTKLKSQTTLQGAIESVEGAKVTISATANLEIDNATIELLNQLPTLPNEDQKFKLARAPLNMAVDSKNAKAVFQLTLDTNREKPIATHYRLNFNSVDGNTPAVPNTYPIRIIPDLAPELEILAPVSAESKVATNGSLNVTAAANDLDYEISFVRIHIEHGGNKVLSEKLVLDNQANNRQKVQARYQIKPEEIGLTTGDQAIFYITAEDNRTSYFSDTDPAPNVTRSKNYSFTVTEPKTPDADQQDKNRTEPNTAPQDNEPSDDPQDPKDDESETGQQDDSSEKTPQESRDTSESDDTQGSKGNEESNQPSEKSPSNNQESGTKDQDNLQPDEQNPRNSSAEESSDETPSKENGGGSTENENPSDDSDTSASPPNNGATGGADQPSENETPAGGGGSETDTDGGDPKNKSNDASTGQRPSDSDPNEDAANAKSGNNPTGNNTVNDSAPEKKDDNLTEGEEQLSSDASEGEKIRRLQDLVGDDPDEREQSGNPDQPNGAQDPERPPNNPSNNPENQNQNPNKSEDSPGTGEDANGTDPGGQNNTPEGQPNSRPQNDSAEGGPQKQNPSGQSKSDPSGSSESPSKPSGQSQTPDTGQAQSQQPDSGPPNGKSNDDTPGGEQPSGDQPGGKQPSDSGNPSDSPSGQGTPGDQPSDQSSSQSQAGGPAGQPGGEPGNGDPKGAGQPQQSSDDAQTDESANPQGGSQSGAGDTGSDVLLREKENLEHSKKAIDLLLNKLRKQRHTPDPELLKKMGWDKQQLNDFIDDWDQMREAATRGEAEARAYERRLKPLGLHPDGKRRTVASNQEKAGDVIQDGVVNEAPPEEYHNFNSFLQDLQRARQ